MRYVSNWRSFEDFHCWQRFTAVWSRCEFQFALQNITAALWTTIFFIYSKLWLYHSWQKRVACVCRWAVVFRLRRLFLKCRRPCRSALLKGCFQHLSSTHSCRAIGSWFVKHTVTNALLFVPMKSCTRLFWNLLSDNYRNWSSCSLLIAQWTVAVGLGGSRRLPAWPLVILSSGIFTFEFDIKLTHYTEICSTVDFMIELEIIVLHLPDTSYVNYINYLVNFSPFQAKSQQSKFFKLALVVSWSTMMLYFWLTAATALSWPDT